MGHNDAANGQSSMSRCLNELVSIRELMTQQNVDMQHLRSEVASLKCEIRTLGRTRHQPEAAGTHKPASYGPSRTSPRKQAQFAGVVIEADSGSDTRNRSATTYDLPPGVNVSPAPPPTIDDLEKRDPLHLDAPSDLPDIKPAVDTKATIKREIKEEIIEVTIKSEDGSEEFRHVSLIKSEDGKLDIWNVDAFLLGAPISVHKRYNRGFTRKVISDALGGGHQDCSIHWGGPTKTKKTPFLCYNRKWNPPLPTIPGTHGIVFDTFKAFNDGTPVNQPLDMFVGMGVNDWRLMGTYNIKRWGEISTHHLQLLPPKVLDLWIKGALKSQWGKRWIDAADDVIREKAEREGTAAQRVQRSPQGLRAALNEGRLVMTFTVLQCVGYRRDWFVKLVHYERHPRAKGEGGGGHVEDMPGEGGEGGGLEEEEEEEGSEETPAPASTAVPTPTRSNPARSTRGKRKRRIYEETSSEHDSDEEDNRTPQTKRQRALSIEV